MAPRFSIVTPVHDPPLPLLRACLASIRAQTLADWELCLVDDGSSDQDVLAELRRVASVDSRVHLRERPVAGGIVAASNEALDAARGEFVVLIDHDDTIEPDALEVVDDALRADPEIDYVYSDEDKLDDAGTVYDLFLKPDWSPERLRSQNYCTHLSVLRREIVDDVGGFREGFDGSQDHDLILRVTERARRVHHVPRVLYHWCVTPGSAAGDPDAKPYAREAGRRAVEEHLTRVGHAAPVELLDIPGHYRVRRTHPDPPFVSIVIPTRGTSRQVWGLDRPLVLGAVESVFESTDYVWFEVVVVADPDTPADVLAALDPRAQVVTGNGDFNFAARCNLGARHAGGDVLLFLNDDVYVEQRDWLDVMVAFLAEPDVGVVGARLLYADGTLQHAGILLNEQPLHIFRGFSADDSGPFGLLRIDREVSAVTGACLLTPQDLYTELGGMNEDFPLAFNDLDYCLRARRTDRRVIWTPHATLFHFESQSRRPDADPADIERVYELWGPELHTDPYGNPGFAPKQAEWVPAYRAQWTSAARQWWRARRMAR